MAFHDLPNELILLIVSLLSTRDLSSLLRVDRALALFLTPLLHKLATEDKDGLPAILWAAKHGHEPLVKLLLGVSPKQYGDSHGSSDNDDNFTVDLLGRRQYHNRAEREVTDSQDDLRAEREDTDSQDDLRTPLTLASANGHDRIVTLLLQQTNTHAPLADDITTSFCLAAENGHTRIIELLLDHGANPNTPGQYDISPLAAAAGSGQDAAVRLLLARGADPNLPIDVVSPSPLSCAASNGNLEVVRTLLDHNADMLIDEPMYNPLAQAAGLGHGAVVRLLVKRGADIEGTVDWRGDGLVLMATSYGKMEMVKTLMDLGAPLDTLNEARETAWTVAHDLGNDEIACLLLARGANIFVRTPIPHLNSGYPNYVKDMILGWINGEKCPLFVEQVLDKLLGISDEKWSGVDEVRIFFEAVSFGKEALVELLLRRGVDVNTRNFEGKTALVIAAGAARCRDEGVHMVEMLLNMGADPRVQAHDGKTALDVATLKNRDTVVGLLMEATANLEL